MSRRLRRLGWGIYAAGWVACVVMLALGLPVWLAWSAVGVGVLAAEGLPRRIWLRGRVNWPGLVRQSRELEDYLAERRRRLDG